MPCRLQRLPRRQRAILILRDVLGWSAKETAEMLDTSVKSVNAALQRARSTMQTQRPLGDDRAHVTPATATERVLLRRYMDAWERKDTHALLWFDGRDAIARLFELYPLARLGEIRMVESAANRQPAAATYLRAPGASEFRLTGLSVLKIEGAEIAEVISFSPALVSAFRLPPTL